jgi:YD repeat-containing protein
MTCRAPSGSSTCAGTQTGAQLGFNNEGELASWQNAPSSPSTTAQFLYDGQGQRVAQAVTQGGTTTTTVYVGSVEARLHLLLPTPRLSRRAEPWAATMTITDGSSPAPTTPPGM